VRLHEYDVETRKAGDARTIVGKKRWGYGRWLGCALIVDAYGFIRRKHVVRSMSP
jgi:hypothetical protein